MMIWGPNSPSLRDRGSGLSACQDLGPVPIFILRYKQLSTVSDDIHHPNLSRKNNEKAMYRVTEQLVQNLLLTSKHKFHFGLAGLGHARPIRNFVSKSTGGFAKAALSPCIWKQLRSGMDLSSANVMEKCFNIAPPNAMQVNNTF